MAEKTPGQQFMEDAIANPIEAAHIVQHGPRKSWEQMDQEWAQRQAVEDRLTAGVRSVRDPRTEKNLDAS